MLIPASGEMALHENLSANPGLGVIIAANSTPRDIPDDFPQIMGVDRINLNPMTHSHTAQINVF